MFAGEQHKHFKEIRVNLEKNDNNYVLFQPERQVDQKIIHNKFTMEGWGGRQRRDGWP